MTKELEAQLAELKKTHGKVTTFTVHLDTDDETKVATLFLKKPDKSTRGIVSKLVEKKQFEQAVQAGLKNLYLGGDSLDLVFDNDDAMASADLGLVEILKVQAATIKKN